MINIIDHAWQFELKEFSILPTVIKIKEHQPKAYFFSLKQRRVMRKKEQTREASLLFLNEGIMPNQNFFMINNTNANEVEFSMILQSQIEEYLKDQGRNLAIIKLDENEDKAMILECSLEVKGKTSIKPLMAFEKAKYYWKYQQYSQIHAHIIEQYMLKLWNELPILIKIQSKIQKLSLILCVTPKYNKINIIWCNQLSFSSKQFYSIYYSIKTHKLQEQKQENKQIVKELIDKNRKDMNIREIINVLQPENIKIEVPSPKAQQEVICNGCARSIDESACKQVSNEDVISLRKRKKLSLRGITQEFFLICQECYYQLDQ